MKRHLKTFFLCFLSIFSFGCVSTTPSIAGARCDGKTETHAFDHFGFQFSAPPEAPMRIRVATEPTWSIFYPEVYVSIGGSRWRQHGFAERRPVCEMFMTRTTKSWLSFSENMSKHSNLYKNADAEKRKELSWVYQIHDGGIAKQESEHYVYYRVDYVVDDENILSGYAQLNLGLMYEDEFPLYEKLIFQILNSLALMEDVDVQFKQKPPLWR